MPVSTRVHWHRQILEWFLLRPYLKTKGRGSIINSLDFLNFSGVEGMVAELKLLAEAVAQALELGGRGSTDVEGEFTSLLLGESNSLGTVGLELRRVSRGNLSGSNLTCLGGGVDL